MLWRFFKGALLSIIENKLPCPHGLRRIAINQTVILMCSSILAERAACKSGRRATRPFRINENCSYQADSVSKTQPRSASVRHQSSSYKVSSPKFIAVARKSQIQASLNPSARLDFRSPNPFSYSPPLSLSL